MSISLFDSHCHFDTDVFDTQRELLWQDCYQQGVRQLLIPGVDPTQWLIAKNLAQNNPGIVMAVGLHPWKLDSVIFPSEDRWEEALCDSYCVAIGECGLDATISVPLEIQLRVFEEHLKLASDKEYPLIIHVRKTHQEVLSLLKKYRLTKGGVIHGFTGSKELATQYWKLGFYLGIGGSITYPRAKKTRHMAKAMPLDALLLETDAPYMPLNGYQGQVNSPLRLFEIAKALADLKGLSLNVIAEQTTANSRLVFNV